MARHPDDKHLHELYRGMPSVTNRTWGAQGQDDGFGYPGQGGYGESRGPSRNESSGRGGSERAAGHRGRGPRNIVRSDERIADDLIERLTRDEDIDASEILVGVDAGTVTLTGEVPERRMKHLAENLASEVQGVREVHNRIQVDKGAKSFGPPGRAVRSGFDQQGSGFSSSEFDQRDDEDDDAHDANRREPMRRPREH